MAYGITRTPYEIARPHNLKSIVIVVMFEIMQSKLFTGSFLLDLSILCNQNIWKGLCSDEFISCW